MEPCEFNPPPKVRSGVIRLRRKENYRLPCNEKLFLQVVKAAFGQRRKTLRNALGAWHGSREEAIPPRFLSLRAEQLSVEDFVELTQTIEAAPLVGVAGGAEEAAMPVMTTEAGATEAGATEAATTIFGTDL